MSIHQLEAFGILQMELLALGCHSSAAFLSQTCRASRSGFAEKFNSFRNASGLWVQQTSQVLIGRYSGLHDSHIAAGTLRGIHPALAVQILGEMDRGEAADILYGMDNVKAASIMSGWMDDAVAAGILSEMDTNDAASILSEMD